MKYFISIITLFLLSGCANIVPLSGGKKDEKIPELVKTNLTETNFNSRHIKLEFDEYITSGNGVDDITIQPKHSTFSVNASDRIIRIDFDSALHPNTTYNLTINNGVKDLNEGNPFSLSYIFSTGPKIDTNFVEYSIIDFNQYKNLKIGLSKNAFDSLHKLKFDYLYPVVKDKILIKGLGETLYNCWIFTDENKDNLPDQYAPVYYDTILLNSSKNILMDKWFDVRNDNFILYKNQTKIIRMIGDLNTYGFDNVIYMDKDSSLFYTRNNDSLPDLDLRKELNQKINSKIQGIKTTKDYMVIIDKCGIKNITITDKIIFKEDQNYFYINSKSNIDSLNFKVTISKDTILFFSKISNYEDMNKISTLKISKNEKSGQAILFLYKEKKIVLTKKIDLKNDHVFYLNPGNYKIELYDSDLYENISFNLQNLRRINCKFIKKEIILKPNWDEVLQVIF